MIILSFRKITFALGNDFRKIHIVPGSFPRIYPDTPAVHAAAQMQSVLSDLEQATRQLSVMDFTGMVENVETLVTTAQESLEQTMGKLNAIDFQTLNKAIEDLSNVVEPMSKLMKVFG